MTIRKKSGLSLGNAVLPVLAVLAIVSISTVATTQSDDADVPYVPTSHETVRTMLEMAKVGADDIVYDLGSGDGRIVIAAVRDFGAKKGVGIDIDSFRVEDANKNAAEAGVTDRVEFIEANIFEHDFSEATVVTMYLLPSVNIRIRPRVLDELRPGTRVVSHRFHMADWEADAEAEPDHSVYFWIVPAKVAGTWALEAGGRNYRLTLEQQYQKVSGTFGGSEQPLPIEMPTLSGTRLRFDVPGSQFARFEGEVTASGTIEGTMVLSSGQSESVVARRVD